MNRPSFVVQPLGCPAPDRLKPALQTAGSWPQLTSKFWRCSLSMNLEGRRNAEGRMQNVQRSTSNVERSKLELDVGRFLEAAEQPALGARTACAACPREPR